MTKQIRDLAWGGCLNVRDLGGMPLAGGRFTPFGRIVRSDSPHRLTAAGQAQLRAYGIRTVIDLRAPGEVKAQPHVFVTDPGEVFYRNLPLESFLPEVRARIARAKSRAEVYNIILDAYPDRLASAVLAIGEAPPGGVLVHCHSGTDRTGMVSALLLQLAGVPEEAIAEDYGLSQVRLGRDNPDPGADAANFWQQPTATPGVMRDMLAHLHKQYGGAAGYLASAGLSAEAIDRISSRLTAP